MHPLFSSRKIAAALALLGITLSSADAQAGYAFRSYIPGLRSGAALSVTPAAFSFGEVPVGQTATANFVISNSGGTAVSGMQYSATGAYTLSGSCTSQIAAGAQCTESLTFTPTTGQAYSGTLTATNGSLSTTAYVSGTGLQTADQVSVGSLDFGNQLVGATSAAKSVVVKNTGNTPLNISQIGTTGNYTAAQNCGSSLAAGVSCTINVSFTPAVLNTNSGTLSIATAAGTHTVSLTGNGQQAILATSPTSLDFGGVPVGTTSPAKTFTLTNSGNIPASGLAVSLPAAYSETTTCGTTLAAGANCSVSLTFSPTTPNTYTGAVQISGSGLAPVNVGVSGTGSQAILSTSPSSLAFGTVWDYSSNTQVLTLTNSGTADASPTFTTTSSYFSVTGCPTVPAGQSCNATVTFNSGTAGTYNDTLRIAGSATGPLSVPLSGTSQLVVLSFTTVGTVNWTVPNRLTSVAALVVGGGGGPTATINGLGGNGVGGGQVVYSGNYSVTPGGSIAVTVGDGGDVGPDPTDNGYPSSFGNLTAAGGLYGGAANGGASGAGYSGGAGEVNGLQGGGGGGAGGPGAAGTSSVGGAGGPGVCSTISGAYACYGGGGGGANAIAGSTAVGAGGVGGGGAGGTTSTVSAGGAPNTGGGGGGGGGGGRSPGAAGVVIISY